MLKPLKNKAMGTILLLLFIGIILGWMSFVLLQVVRDRKTAAWEQKYKEIQDDVENSPVTIDNFNRLTGLIIELWGMPGYNKEKYQVLRDQFLRKFCNIK